MTVLECDGRVLDAMKGMFVYVHACNCIQFDKSSILTSHSK